MRSTWIEPVSFALPKASRIISLFPMYSMLYARHASWWKSSTIHDGDTRRIKFQQLYRRNTFSYMIAAKADRRESNRQYPGMYVFSGRIFRVTEGAHPSRWIERGVLYAWAVPRRFSFRENKLPPITSTLSRYIEQTAAIRRRSWVTTRGKIRFRARIRGRVDLKVQ